MSKLIIIRGNSASGKSTVAKELRKRISERTALIEQDYVRRHVLGEIQELNKHYNIDLIKDMVNFSLKRSYIVILEGILKKSYYEKMLLELLEPLNNVETYVYYIDVDFEETLKRHATKSIKDEVGEDKLKEWYFEKDYLQVSNEVIIPQEFSVDDAVKTILRDIE